MDRLELFRLRGSLGSFSQYLPDTMRDTALLDESITIGAVFDHMACGVAMAEQSDSGFYLRYVYIDPKARLCGLGTYLLRGMLGVAEDKNAEWVKAVFTMDMFEDGKLSGCFVRAGFSNPAAISTCFTIPLEFIALPPGRDNGFETLPLNRFSPKQQHAYLYQCDWGELPAYVDIREAESELSHECSLACLKDGVLAAVMIVQEQPEGLFLQGLYVMEKFRGTGAAWTLIGTALEAANRIYPPDTPLCTSTINMDAMNICYKLFDHERMQKQTEYMMTYNLRKGE